MSSSSGNVDSSSHSSSDESADIEERRKRRHQIKEDQERMLIDIMALKQDLLSDEYGFQIKFGLSKTDFLSLKDLIVKEIHKRLSSNLATAAILDQDKLALFLRYAYYFLCL